MNESTERAAFEAWAREHLGQGYSLARDEGVYVHPVTRWAFRAYNAGRASQSAPSPVEDKDGAGYVSVPVEPTEAMLDAVIGSDGEVVRVSRLGFVDAYKAMIAAAIVGRLRALAQEGAP